METEPLLAAELALLPAEARRQPGDTISNTGLGAVATGGGVAAGGNVGGNISTGGSEKKG